MYYTMIYVRTGSGGVREMKSTGFALSIFILNFWGTCAVLLRVGTSHTSPTITLNCTN